MRRVFSFTVTLALGAALGAIGYANLHKSTPHSSTSAQVRSGEGVLTNPLLECEIAQGTIDAEKINFRSDLEKLVTSLEKKTSASEIAVYFRDLNNGPTFGIQQDDPFIPASLLKVPVMMAFFRAAEDNPSILQKEITFQEKRASPVEQTILPEETLEVGKAYTVSELIERMIIYSDNESLFLLLTDLPGDDIRHLYDLLDVDANVLNDPSSALSVKQYAAFFRILYNASFLSQAHSEQALSLLSKIDFTEGLRKGVPDKILVAHKFGERQINDGERHLHDCGIVYYPKHPYLLCIMTRGEEVPTLERAVADISEFVYKKIDSQYR